MPRCLIYQQLGDLRVLSNTAVGRQESHESGDWLAMDEQDRETAGKRKTMNSSSLSKGEKDLAQAKKESERQAKKELKRKEKEERVLQHTLALSRHEARMDGSLAISEQEAHRQKEAAHLLNVHTAITTELSQLHLLGTVASSSTCTSSSTSLVARIPQGKEECDHNDQVLDRDDFSPFSSFDLSDSNRESGEDQKQESSDSLSALACSNNPPDVITSDEVVNMSLEEPPQQRISSEMSDAVRQRHLDELEVQYQFNNTMARYAEESSSSKNDEAPVDLSEENKDEKHDDGDASVSSAGSHPSRISRDFQCSSVELNSQSDMSRGSSSVQGSISERSSSSSGSNRDFTKEIYSRLMESSDKWASETDVIHDMKSLSLSETKVSIRSEVMAGIVFESRAVCDMTQLLKVQARNFEKAHKDLKSELQTIKHAETRKIQQARRLLEDKMRECDDKSRELDSRIKASSLFVGGEDSVSALETALEAADNENRALKDRVRALEMSLKDMVSNGVSRSTLKGKGIVTRIKSEPSCSPPNPARSSSSATGYSSASSATSLPSSGNSSPYVESTMIGLELHRIKRELSPASKLRDEDFVPKKPKQHQTPWTRWNSEGMNAADDFIHSDGKRFIQTKSTEELQLFRTRVQEAQEDFKSLFPKDLPHDEGIARRDAEAHAKYHWLQLDLGIPGPSNRTYSVHFYYGKVLGCINNILKKRADFRKYPPDNRKIKALMEHLGKDHPDVKVFLTAERHLRKINEKSPCVTLGFQTAYVNLSLPNAELPPWLHRANFKTIRDNVRDRIPMPLSDRDGLYKDCLRQFNDFFYNLHSHEEMSFYERARIFANSQFANKSNGGRPQAKN